MGEQLRNPERDLAILETSLQVLEILKGAYHCLQAVTKVLNSVPLVRVGTALVKVAGGSNALLVHSRALHSRMALGCFACTEFWIRKSGIAEICRNGSFLDSAIRVPLKPIQVKILRTTGLAVPS